MFSWNVSGDAFVKAPIIFKSLLENTEANIILLDEVSNKTIGSQIRKVLPNSTINNETNWDVIIGSSGGRQRNVIASSLPIETLPEFSKIVPYPESEKIRLKKRIIKAGEIKYSQQLDSGIPVNGAIVIDADKRLLVISLDLECCGNDPSSWEEDKRRVEVREIKKLIQTIATRVQIDGIIVAGDFNLVSTVIPLIIISGPYKKPHSGLIAAELMHLDGTQTWTWDGRGTSYPSRVMDLVIYSPKTLNLTSGNIFNPDNISLQEQQKLGLSKKGFTGISEHLPLIIEFIWN
ncbi:endonuclease/exonuclease/phosphatase family protein [Paraglaciecola sp. 2405UD69-4]|uniref:endonuclease/exonuclease/phosphatase family protein n=1 Tax=Paraglaciecola sp. 2405UD69-4 TaxID=3391836 RepID=UPI0039C97964